MQALWLARSSFETVCRWADRSHHVPLKLASENDRLRREIALLAEELRIGDARFARVPRARRPRLSPVERMAILELQIARGWSGAEAAARFGLSTSTLATWMTRLDEETARPLVQTHETLEDGADLLGHVGRRLAEWFPRLGSRPIAEALCRCAESLEDHPIPPADESPFSSQEEEKIPEYSSPRPPELEKFPEHA